MSSPLPVPSKAALTALRGLVLGTSCTLALIAEDRRRKINNALQVIENGERIRGARNYRDGGAALLVAMEEEAMLDRGMVSSWSSAYPQPQQQSRSGTLITAPKRRGSWGHEKPLWESKSSALEAAVGPSRVISEAAAVARQDQPLEIPHAVARPPPQKPSPFIPPLSDSPVATNLAGPIRSQRSAPLGTWEFPSPEEIMERIVGVCDTKDPKELDSVVRLVLGAYEANVAPDNNSMEWWQESGRLCRTCLELGRVEDARKLLAEITRRGAMPWGAYEAHQPVPLIRAILRQSRDAYKSTEANRMVTVKDRFNAAVELYLAKFDSMPTNPTPRYSLLGRDLLSWAFQLGLGKPVEEIYWRCFRFQSGDEIGITASFIAGLRKIHEPKLAIRVFRLNFSKLLPYNNIAANVGDDVVQCVLDAHDYQAHHVLRALTKLCDTDRLRSIFKVRWLMQLLEAFWRRKKDLGALEELFQKFMASEVGKALRYPDGGYRVMVEISLAAGDIFKAESYFDELCAIKPEKAKDIHLLGHFAKAKAKIGDWDGVRGDFETMAVDDTPESLELLAQVFTPVLKIYLEDHTMSEAEEFIRHYMDELKVPPARYLVTLVAKHYAMVRDADSFVAWIRYCVSAGFEIDGAFSSAILANCAKHWKFHFKDLRRVYLTLKELCPGSIDRNTERIMVDAACSVPKLGGNAAFSLGRVKSLGIATNQFAFRGKSEQSAEVLTAMRTALAARKPAQTVKIYKKAIHRGMPIKQQTLRLAVRAGFCVDNKIAHAIIRDAAQKGEDVNEVMHDDMMQELNDIDARMLFAKTPRAVRAIMTQFESSGLAITPRILDKAGRVCLQGKCFTDAAQYALQAARLHGELCYNVYNFVTLVEAYAAVVDLGGVREVVTRALAKEYRTSPSCYKGLKQARAQLRKNQVGAPEELVDEIEALLHGAMEEVFEARKEFDEVKHRIERDTLDIMRRAALYQRTIPPAAELQEDGEHGPFAEMDAVLDPDGKANRAQASRSDPDSPLGGLVTALQEGSHPRKGNAAIQDDDDPFAELTKAASS